MVAKSLHLNWFNPVQITFGYSFLQHIPEEGDFVVLADPAALGNAHESALRERLGNRCKCWSVTRAGLASVEHAQQLCTELWPVLLRHPHASILAVGGGTTLDLAKLIRYRFDACDVLSASDYWRSNTLPTHYVRHALWAIPTTAGTGGEVTRWATVWDTQAMPPAKLSWAPEQGFPDRALVDPELSYSCPVRVTRDCGLDALSHALESLWNCNANPVTSGLALQAAQDVIKALPDLLHTPKNIAARTTLSRASLLAGLAMSQTQTALSHALSYEVTLKEGLPHGEAVALWLPMAWDLALGHSANCDESLARVFGGSAEQGTSHLRQWLAELDIVSRDLRTDIEGRATLEKELQSTRGRNFIGKFV